MRYQSKRILQHLLRGRSITPLKALRMYGCLRLSARIYDFRKVGYKIKTVMVDYGDKRVARYSLKK